MSWLETEPMRRLASGMFSRIAQKGEGGFDLRADFVQKIQALAVDQLEGGDLTAQLLACQRQ